MVRATLSESYAGETPAPQLLTNALTVAGAAMPIRSVAPALLAWVILLSAVCAADADGQRAERRETARDAYRWFSIPIEITALPTDARFVPVACRINFSDLLKQLGVSGVVDQNSLRLYRLPGEGPGVEQPVQFTPEPQPRPAKPARLADTPAGVSYIGEYRAGVTPDGVQVAGEVAWIAEGNGDGSARYRLEFGVRRDGLVVQVPYPPQDLKVFDGDGRATPVRHFPRMQVGPDRPLGGQVHFSDGPNPVTTYHLGPALGPADAEGSDLPAPPPNALAPPRRPFLYPVLGPDGDPLTGFGKPHDPTGSHAHHYSLWIAHASADAADFWSESGGTIVSAGLPESDNGPVFCRLVHDTRWMQGGRELLVERRRIVLHRTPESFRALDIELELKPPGQADVTLSKTSFGFLAARVARSMTVFDGGGEIVNARSDRNERGAHLRRAEWLDQSGPVGESRQAGIALLDHPDNPNHPTTWHCRNDGWACAAFAADAPYTIAAGKALRLRYRVVLHRGDAREGEVARRFAEFAAKPVVRLGPAAAMNEK